MKRRLFFFLIIIIIGSTWSFHTLPNSSSIICVEEIAKVVVEIITETNVIRCIWETTAIIFVVF